MRTLVAGLLALTLIPSIQAQGVIGRYSMKNQQGAPIVLVLEANGPGKVKGSFSGNGIHFTLEGEVDGAEAAGTLKGATGTALFEAVREGNQLALTLVEVDANGIPNPATVRQVALTFDPSARPAPATQQGSALRGDAPAASVPLTGGSAQDEQLRQLLLSSAWCTFSYSGGSTYTGGSYGRSSSTRTVFSANGFLQQTSSSESTNSGAPGSVYGSNSGGTSARWRVQDGTLSVSGDGVQWTPVRLEINRNSNGYPIVKADGVEYMQCR